MPYLTADVLSCNQHLLVCPYSYSLLGKNRIDWTADALYPHLFYLHEGRRVDRFFGGVLFEAMRSKSGEILSPKGMGLGKEGTMASRLEALESLFTPGYNIPALLEVSKEMPAGEWVDLYIALPYPFPLSGEGKEGTGFPAGGGTESGGLGGRKEELIAWVEGFMQRWQEWEKRVPGHRVRPVGMAWTKSSMDPLDEGWLPEVAQAVHRHGLKWFWLQNYGTAKAMGAKGFGFDAVFIRPTFLGGDPRGERWLFAAAKWAYVQGFGIIHWGDERFCPEQLLHFLNAGQRTYMHALQIYELGEEGILSYYKRKDPRYVYLYAYTKGAYVPIPVPQGSEGKGL